MLIKLTSDERWKTVTNKRLCFNCLQRGCQLSKHSNWKECVDGCLKMEVQTLGLTGRLDPLNIQWTNSQTNSLNESLNVSSKIAENETSEVFELVNVHTMSNLNLPIQTVNVSNLRSTWTYLSNVDVKPLVGAKPHILIGQDNYHWIAPREIIESPPNAPVATKTKLGWLIHAVNYCRQKVDYTFTIVNANKQEHESLHNLVKEHFKIESLGRLITMLSAMQKFKGPTTNSRDASTT
ncbi:unnamed protein product [Allacma fusca]|uniref:Uncharacterized protein n=1 Tax=Allacma fusca TaxID=39272 RepID=A0A8J2JC62_9HEXA|nr:unnamed protein product [Allacma fusca]